MSMCGSRPLYNCLVKIFLPHHLFVIYLLSLPRLATGQADGRGHCTGSDGLI